MKMVTQLPENTRVRSRVLLAWYNDVLAGGKSVRPITIGVRRRVNILQGLSVKDAPCRSKFRSSMMRLATLDKIDDDNLIARATLYTTPADPTSKIQFSKASVSPVS